jgi:hypothetical protein
MVTVGSSSAKEQKHVETRVIVNATFGRDRSVELTKVRDVESRGYKANASFTELSDIKNQIRTTGALNIPQMAYGGGTIVIVQSLNGDRYMLSSLRNATAPSYPNTLSPPSGVAEVPNISPLFKEAVEEILIFVGDKVIVPKLTTSPIDQYNKLMENVVADTVRAFAQFYDTDKIPTQPLVREAKSMEIFNPFNYNGIPIGVGFYKQRGLGIDGKEQPGDKIALWDMIFSPIIIPLGVDLNSPNVTFRETLGLEIGERKKELDVVLLKLEGNQSSPEVITYRQGEKKEFASLKDFIRSKSDEEHTVMREDRLFEPTFATILAYTGYDSRFFRDRKVLFYPTLSEVFLEQTSYSKKLL